jgi:hypothetical protein
MRIAALIIGVVLFLPVSTARAQEEAPATVTKHTPGPAAKEGIIPTVAAAPATRGQVGAAFLPMLLGRVATGPSGNSTSSNLVFAYGVGLSVGYRVLAGLSVGLAPQIISHLSSKDSAGYPVIDSEKEYDLMARVAYAYALVRKLDVYAEVLPGYSFVTYNKIILGAQVPKARGIVLGSGLGAAFNISDRFFANAGVGYQVGFQESSGISNRNVRTRFLRIALGGGVKF